MTTIAIAGAAHIHISTYFAWLKEHAAEVRVKGVWDDRKERSTLRAAELHTAVVETLDEILNDPEVDALLVCSETFLHGKIVAAASKARKHLFVEKPLGMNGKESLLMAAQIENAGIKFQTGFGKRIYPYNRFLRQQIQQGNFGKVTRLRANCVHGGALRDKFDTEWRWMADPARSGGGGFFDLGVHAVDWLTWMMGPVEEVTASIHQADGRYPGCDEFGEGLLRFRNGAIGTVAAGWVDVGNAIDFEIWGTEGHAYVTRDDKLFFKSSRVNAADGKTPWIDLPAATNSNFHQFLEAVSGKADRELIGAREAAYVDTVMEALYEASRFRKYVSLPPTQVSGR